MPDSTPAKKTAAKKTVAKKATEPTRRKRSLKEKAEDALRIEQNRVDALKERGDRLKAEHDAVTIEYTQAVKRRDYLAQDPALETGETSTAAALLGADQ